jgi:hypothetical protein
VDLNLLILSETKRALLREVCHSARLISFKRRTNVLHAVHGKVHGGMEYSQQAVHLEDTAGKWPGLEWWRNVLIGTIELEGK